MTTLFSGSELSIAMASQNDPAAVGPTSRVYEGVMRSTTGPMEQPELSGVHKSSSLDVLKGATNILGTALNNAGSPTSRLTPETSVLMDPANPSSRISLQTAERMGLVNRNAYGDYAEVTAPVVQGATEGNEAQPQESEGPALFDVAQEAAYGEAITDVPQLLYDNAMTSAANRVAGGGSLDEITADLDRITASLASTSGVPVETLRQAQQIGVLQFQSQADAAIKDLGVQPAQLYAWAKENKAQELGAAVRQQVGTRSTVGYQELAMVFKQQVSPAQSELSRNGFETRKENGVDMVNIGGMWTTVKAANRMGRI